MDFSPHTKEPFLRNIVPGEISSQLVDVDKTIPIVSEILNVVTEKDANV